MDIDRSKDENTSLVLTPVPLQGLHRLTVFISLIANLIKTVSRVKLFLHGQLFLSANLKKEVRS
jgi:hypothetical protein